MTRIATYAHGYKRPPERRKPLADVPVIVTPADTKKGRRPVLAREAAAEVFARLAFVIDRLAVASDQFDRLGRDPAALAGREKRNARPRRS